MFWKWFKKRKPNRAIFRYFDGERIRSIDPVQAMIDLNGHPEYNYRIHPKQLDNGDPEALEVVCRAVVDTFGVKPFDRETETGLTKAEILELFGLFTVYVGTLKKNGRDSQTSQDVTEPTSTESGEPTTKPTQDSGSTGTALSCEPQTEPEPQ